MFTLVSWIIKYPVNVLLSSRFDVLVCVARTYAGIAKVHAQTSVNTPMCSLIHSIIIRVLLLPNKSLKNDIWRFENNPTSVLNKLVRFRSLKITTKYIMVESNLTCHFTCYIVSNVLGYFFKIYFYIVNVNCSALPL